MVMRQIVTLIRYLGLLAGLFLVASSIADIAGLIPYSDAMPTVRARVASNIAPFLFGAVLLLPHRWFLVGPRFHFLFCAYLLLIGAALYKAADTFVMVWTGAIDPAAISVALSAASIPLLNGAVLWFQRQSRTPPNNSFKPNPHQVR